MGLEVFQSHLGYTFTNEALLRQALTHPSRTFEQKRSPLDDNQRLEFLGDAVLQLVVTEYLYQQHPEEPEGTLTARRARLVNRSQMHALADRLGLSQLIVLGRGEETNGGRTRPSNLADATEALLGAIYLDSGYASARDVIITHLLSQVEETPDAESSANPKGTLQEKLQISGQAPPLYISIGEEGPAHARRYSVKVEWQGHELGRGEGASKKEAEANAARVALQLCKEAIPPEWLVPAEPAQEPPSSTL
jgi:ribonuclease-3